MIADMEQDRFRDRFRIKLGDLNLVGISWLFTSCLIGGFFGIFASWYIELMAFVLVIAWYMPPIITARAKRHTDKYPEGSFTVVYWELITILLAMGFFVTMLVVDGIITFSK